MSTAVLMATKRQPDWSGGTELPRRQDDSLRRLRP